VRGSIVTSFTIEPVHLKHMRLKDTEKIKENSIRFARINAITHRLYHSYSLLAEMLIADYYDKYMLFY